MLSRCGALLFLAAMGAQAQVIDPVPDPIALGERAVRVALVAVLPDSGSASRPRARPMLLSGDGRGRRFVADQNGIVYQLDGDGSLSVFLDVAGVTDLDADQKQKGLSSFAFHPDYFEAGSAGFGRFYTASAQSAASGTADYPVPAGAPLSHHTVIHEWGVSADPNAIDPSSAREVIRIGQPYGDHNVGQIAFDPNVVPGSGGYGLLYIAMGDGGNLYPPVIVDPHLTAQDLSVPLGALLRIDPLQGALPYAIPPGNPFASDGDPTTLGEIWAYGLRNPHRFFWDTAGDGRMLISDIGQANLEEIDLGAPGANYGWSAREGTFLVMQSDPDHVFPLPPDDAAFGFTYPVVQYDRDEGGSTAVSGGYVYRGAGIPWLRGRYVFGDLPSGRVFQVSIGALDGSGQVAFEELPLVDVTDGLQKSLLEIIGGSNPAPRADLRFGMDDAGAIYLLTKQDGAIRRFVSVEAVPGPGLFALATLYVAMMGAARCWIMASPLRRHPENASRLVFRSSVASSSSIALRLSQNHISEPEVLGVDVSGEVGDARGHGGMEPPGRDGCGHVAHGTRGGHLIRLTRGGSA